MDDCRKAFEDWDNLSDLYNREAHAFADSVCNLDEEPDKWNRAVAFYAAWNRRTAPVVSREAIENWFHNFLSSEKEYKPSTSYWLPFDSITTPSFIDAIYALQLPAQAAEVPSMQPRSDDWSLELWTHLPKDQVDRVMDFAAADIEPQFLGFVETYAKLADLIPKHWTVVDLGCAYAPQAWYFRNHKVYIGVDKGPIQARFSWENTEHFEGTIQQFLHHGLDKLNLEETFAIMSYVPTWYGLKKEAVRRAFPNLYTFYPHGNDPALLVESQGKQN